jgi:serine/threonine-protein kinase
MVGSVIENYKIISVLGEGGMGVVYKALDMKLERFVALKILSTQSANNPQFIERFKREARNQAKLNHPNIVPVYGFTDDRGILGIAMEYVEGDTLEKIIYKKKRLEVVEALEILLQILQGVGYAHTKGFIHRDIKPSNIIINREGKVKIMDFGISKSMFDKGITKTGTKIGTILYMSPEQIRAEEPTRQSDIYSIGISFYEMLIGKTPFDLGTEYEIMEAHLKKNPGRVSLNIDSVPPEIDKIVAKALDKSLQKRYLTCEEFSEDVETLLHKLKKNRPDAKKSKKDKDSTGQWGYKIKLALMTLLALGIFSTLTYFVFNAVRGFWPRFKAGKQVAASDTTAGVKYREGNISPTGWTTLSTGITVNLTSIQFINSNEGFAVGERGTIIHTTDAGDSWQRITPPDSLLSFNDLYFQSNMSGFIIGEQGKIFQTLDGGKTWKDIRSGVGETLFRIRFNQSYGFIIGSKGVILRSVDGGQNWERFFGNTSNLLYGIDFTNNSTGYIVGWSGTLLKTTDSGSSWTHLPAFTDNYLKDVEFVNETVGYIAAAGGEVFKTVDGGATWRKIDSKASGIVSLYFPDVNHGFAVSNKGEVLETFDGGGSWLISQGGNYLSLSRIAGIGSSIFVSGYNGTVLRAKF